ncbi:AMP-binding protein [Jonesiaceae bacterium BS-20]|uniref:AMP-binding protein n=1 Tax=Jonesiaceae bacterium BS-20 TaxID=3120821 RepID=A0AAU7DR88_9MICO
MSLTSFSSSTPGQSYTQADLIQILSPNIPGFVLVQTSGSTGQPRTVVVSADALRESGAATARFFGNKHGQWLLTLPTNHIAGIQVLARSTLAGHPVIAMDLSAGFTVASFLAACAKLTQSVTFTSLVPTQLHRLLGAPAAVRDEVVAALASFEAILLGGAAAPGHLLQQCAALGITVVTTYGMSETAGGCVYNGLPLDVASVRTEDPTRPSRILISGPMLANGYLKDGKLQEFSDAFFADPNGVRWHRTNDLGVISPEGTLTVVGRADDIIISGGQNVSPNQVEQLLTGKFGLGQVCVVGVPDPTWGQRVVAVVESPDVECAVSENDLLDNVRRFVADNLDRSASPTQILVMPGFPLTESGKVDRRAVTRWASTQN